MPITTVGILLLLGFSTKTEQAHTIEYPDNSFVLIEENSVRAVPPILNPSNFNKNGVLAGFWGLDDIDDYLLSCLIKEESSGNPLSYNPKDTDGYPKYGLLQFHKPTFQEWCVNKYGLVNDIWNEKIQIECFIKMKKDGQLWRWPPVKRCIP